MIASYIKLYQWKEASIRHIISGILLFLHAQALVAGDRVGSVSRTELDEFFGCGEVIVCMRGGGRFVGSITASTEDSLVLTLEGRMLFPPERKAIPMKEIEEVICRDSITNGLIMGYIGGTMAGAIPVSIAIATEETLGKAVMAGIFYSSIIFGPIGMIVGGVIDRRLEKRVEAPACSTWTGEPSVRVPEKMTAGPYIGFQFPFEETLQELEVYGVKWQYTDEHGVLYELSAHTTGKNRERWRGVSAAIGLTTSPARVQPYILVGTDYIQIAYYEKYGFRSDGPPVEETFLELLLGVGIRIKLGGERFFLNPEYRFHFLGEGYHLTSLGLGFRF